MGEEEETTPATAPPASTSQHGENGVGTTTTAKKPRRVIRRKKRVTDEPPAVDPILLQKVLTESGLPKAYQFELVKTTQRIVTLQANHVALQMPEGLLLYATVLADALKRLAAPTLQDVSILGDVTYGACCVGDLDARALGAQLLVHYGHSCLVPLQHTVIPCLYVFVEIQIDVPHLVDCLHTTLHEQNQPSQPHIYLLGTVQFRHALAQTKELLQIEKKYEGVSIPQAKPLSPGEVLGCTSPKLDAHQTSTSSAATADDDETKSKHTKSAICCFVADGRFHLESTLISNPHIDVFYRYDPYSKTLTEESYDHDAMKSLRHTALQQAKSATTFGIILGTLGRQGNPAIVQRIQATLKQHYKKSFVLLLSEITPAKLHLFGTKIDAWVQVACPRLSVDWGHFLAKVPVLTPYELYVALEETTWQNTYPMDYYSLAGGPWSNYYKDNQQRQL